MYEDRSQSSETEIFLSGKLHYAARWHQGMSCSNHSWEYIQNLNINLIIRTAQTSSWTRTCRVRCISIWTSKLNSVCVCVCFDSCVRLSKTGAEPYEMIRPAFGESCPKSIEDFCGFFYSALNVERRSTEDDPLPWQTIHLLHRRDRSTCTRNYSR